MPIIRSSFAHPEHYTGWLENHSALVFFFFSFSKLTGTFQYKIHLRSDFLNTPYSEAGVGGDEKTVYTVAWQKPNCCTCFTCVQCVGGFLHNPQRWRDHAGKILFKRNNKQRLLGAEGVSVLKPAHRNLNLKKAKVRSNESWLLLDYLWEGESVLSNFMCAKKTYFCNISKD